MVKSLAAYCMGNIGVFPPTDCGVSSNIQAGIGHYFPTARSFWWESPGTLYHLTSRCERWRDFYRDDEDRDLRRRAKSNSLFQTISIFLMDSTVRLLVGLSGFLYSTSSARVLSAMDLHMKGRDSPAMRPVSSVV